MFNMENKRKGDLSPDSITPAMRAAATAATAPKKPGRKPGEPKGIRFYTALGMEISSSGRCKNTGEQLKVLRNKGSRFFLMFSVRS
jgi:hypothetical protein